MSKAIQSTKNYDLFHIVEGGNRKLDLKKHRKLYESMKTYGFLRCFPVVCGRDKDGNNVVKDGQHRLAIAKILGLPVHWVVEEKDFDVALINCTPKTWGLRDYAEKFQLTGKADYGEGLDFAAQHSLPIGTAFALLSGNTSFSNIQEDFISGKFKVKDRSWADAVANLYGPMVVMAPALKTARFIEACMMVCRISDFSAQRVLGGAERCREKLVAYSTKEAYLDLLDTLYNFGRKQHFGLKAAAINAMKARNPAHRGNGKLKAKDEAA